MRCFAMNAVRIGKTVRECVFVERIADYEGETLY